MKVQNKANVQNSNKKMERDLRECMHCHYFWGNDSRCRTSECIKKEPKQPVKVTECTDCPYKQSETYCFPCMKKILQKKTGENDVEQDI